MPAKKDTYMIDTYDLDGQILTKIFKNQYVSILTRNCDGLKTSKKYCHRQKCLIKLHLQYRRGHSGVSTFLIAGGAFIDKCLHFPIFRYHPKKSLVTFLIKQLLYLQTNIYHMFENQERFNLTTSQFISSEVRRIVFFFQNISKKFKYMLFLIVLLNLLKLR